MTLSDYFRASYSLLSLSKYGWARGAVDVFGQFCDGGPRHGLVLRLFLVRCLITCSGGIRSQCERT